MASFKLADIVVDRVVCGLGETSDGELLYMLTNCQDANIDIVCEISGKIPVELEHPDRHQGDRVE